MKRNDIIFVEGLSSLGRLVTVVSRFIMYCYQHTESRNQITVLFYVYRNELKFISSYFNTHLLLLNKTNFVYYFHSNFYQW